MPNMPSDAAGESEEVYVPSEPKIVSSAFETYEEASDSEGESEEEYPPKA